MKKVLVLVSFTIFYLSFSAFAKVSPLDGLTACGEFKIENDFNTDLFRLKDNKDRILLEFNNGENTNHMSTKIGWSPACKYLVVYPSSSFVNWRGLTLVNTQTLTLSQPKNMEPPAKIAGRDVKVGMPAVDDFGKHIAFAGWVDHDQSAISYWNIDTGKRFLDIPYERKSMNGLDVKFAEGNSSLAIERQECNLVARNIETGTILYNSDACLSYSKRTGSFEWGVDAKGNTKTLSGYQFSVVNSSDLKYRAELFALDSAPLVIGVRIYSNGFSKYIQPPLKQFVLQTNQMFERMYWELNTFAYREIIRKEIQFAYSPNDLLIKDLQREVSEEIWLYQSNAYFLNNQFFIRTDYSDLRKYVITDIL